MTRIRPESGGSSELAAYLAADEAPLTSQVSLVTSGLAVEVEANATYAFEAYIAFDCSQIADLKMQWSAPAGTTGWWSPNGATVGSGSATPQGSLNFVVSTIDQIAVAGGAAVGNVGSAAPRGLIKTTSAGTFAFQYAQNTSDATALTVRAGSWLRLIRIA